MLSFLLRDVLGEILGLIESVSEGFLPTPMNEPWCKYFRKRDICLIFKKLWLTIFGYGMFI